MSRVITKTNTELSMADNILPTDIWLIILGDIHEIPRQLFRRVSRWFTGAIPRKKYKVSEYVPALYLHWTPESAYQFVVNYHGFIPAEELFYICWEYDRNSAMMIRLLTGKFERNPMRVLERAIEKYTNDQIADFIISADQQLLPGESSEEKSARYGLLKAATSAGNVELVKYFLVVRKTIARVGLLESIGLSANLEIMQMLEKLWRFPRDPAKQTDRIQVILKQIPQVSLYNSRAAAEFLVGLRDAGLIDSDTIIWKSRGFSGVWTLRGIVRTHGDYSGLRQSLAELGWTFT